MIGIDPILSLQNHIALLTLLQAARDEVIKAKGINLVIAKGLGRLITAKLEQSKAKMRENKMWVQDDPIGERRYRYSLFGRRDEYEIPQADLDHQVRMALTILEQELVKSNTG